MIGSIGDSLVVVSDDRIVDHVHNHPGLTFEEGLTYSSLSRMKVDNIREEHEERVIRTLNVLQNEHRLMRQKQKRTAASGRVTEHKECGFITYPAVMD